MGKQTKSEYLAVRESILIRYPNGEWSHYLEMSSFEEAREKAKELNEAEAQAESSERK